jgi:hypothetical protein
LAQNLLSRAKPEESGPPHCRTIEMERFLMAVIAGLVAFVVGSFIWIYSNARNATFTLWPVIGFAVIVLVVTWLISRRS